MSVISPADSRSALAAKRLREPQLAQTRTGHQGGHDGLHDIQPPSARPACHATLTDERATIPSSARPIGGHLDYVKSAVSACWFQLIIAQEEQMALAKWATSESARHTFASQR